jgi:hypothetical protein
VASDSPAVLPAAAAAAAAPEAPEAALAAAQLGEQPDGVSDGQQDSFMPVAASTAVDGKVTSPQ